MMNDMGVLDGHLHKLPGQRPSGLAQENKAEKRTHYPYTDYTGVLDECLEDAIDRYFEEFPNDPRKPKHLITDMRMHTQRWPDSSCGFGAARTSHEQWLERRPGTVEGVETLAPTVIVKIHKQLRYVYHAGHYAYTLRGKVSVPYYNAVMRRALPGQIDASEIRMLVS